MQKAAVGRFLVTEMERSAVELGKHWTIIGGGRKLAGSKEGNAGAFAGFVKRQRKYLLKSLAKSIIR